MTKIKMFGLLAVATLASLSAQAALIHRYSFTSNADDSVGTAHGVMRGNAAINSGAVVLDGVNSYVDFPNGILTNLTSITMEFWLTDNGSGNWSRIYDFGNATAGEDFATTTASAGTTYMFLTPNSGSATLRGAYTITGGGAGEQIVEWSGTRLPTGVQKHVVWTSDAASQTARLFVDGVQVGINTGVTLTPAALGNTVNNWLGRSQFNGDAFLKASVTEFRMYDVALTQQQIQDDLTFGPDVATQQGPATFVKQPVSQTVTELQPVSFVTSVNGTPPYSYQWYRNDALIPGATNDTYAIAAAALSDSGIPFRVTVSNNFNGTPTLLTSTNALLTVNADTVAPTLVRAASLFPNGVLIEFSEGIRPETGTNLANYTITSTNGSLTLSNATMGSGNASVVLGTSPQALGTFYTVTVNNLRDLSAASNAIAPNSQTTFLAIDLVGANIGNASIPGSFTTVAGGYDISAGGTGIGSSSDQFSFNYQLRNGDFDVQLRVASLPLVDTWSRAGLMARESLGTNSVFAAAFATPTMNGEFFQYRGATGAASVNAGNFPANYPNSWLRLKRVGNVFTGYGSYDGQTWVMLGSTTLSLPSSIYLGLAVSSQNSAQSVGVQLRDFAPVTGGAIVSNLKSPYEPLGPSSRLTGLSISEIMYKPAKRADLKNTEYLEIYNSNPYFHDLSGYRLSGDIEYTFPAGTVIGGGSFKVVAFSPGDIQAVYGITGVLGPYTNSLKRSGTVRLRDEQNAILLEVNYSGDNPWPVAADGSGHSLILARPSYGENDPRAWDISDVVGGTPGAAESYRPSPLRNVVINEIFAYDSAGLNDDYVELYNHGNNPVDISGCILTDDVTTNKYVIPAGVVLPARGFAAFNGAQLGFGLSSGGETILFKNPAGTRVLDALQFEAQADGISFGRFPDGAAQFYPMASRTPGLPNSALRVHEVVINEIMYDPITGRVDDQFIELYNQGTNAVNLGGWRFTAGINFTFPSNTVLPADGYVVVAANRTNLLAKYANLNLNNTFGDFSGKLSKSSERVALSMPQTVIGTNSLGAKTTNVVYPVVDEVTYSGGGRWGNWANGGGSSLELLDPRSNHRLAANWGDSDDTSKSSWTNIEVTGVLDNGNNFDATLDYAQIGLLDAAECLVDNIEVRPGTSGANYVSNPDFESGSVNWNFMGSHSRSSLETNAGYGSAVALHLRSSDTMWTGINAAQVMLTNTTLVSGSTATLRYKARWLHGRPETLFRLHGNWLEAPGTLPVPANLGTPGARNSIAVTNAAPAIFEVAHAPAVPAANQPVVVTARVHDASGLQSVTLNYRIDPGTSYTAVTMLDNGTGGDAIAGDGIYSATIPGNAANVVVPFYISASDSFGAQSRFPALLADNSPVRECIVLFGDGQPAGSFGTYHLWLTQTNVDRWVNLGVVSNEGVDGTFVYNDRIVYNMSGRYAGSPYHQSFNSPYGNACHYSWQMPSDDQVLGTSSFSKIHWPGNDIQDDAAGTPNDGTLQREQASNALLRGLGIPWVYRRYVAVYVNGRRRGQLMEDSRVPNGDVMKSQFPNDSNSFLFKFQPWFEVGMNQNADHTVNWANKEWCYLLNWTTTGGAKKLARYRWHYQMRQTPDSASNYTNVYQLIDAAGSWTNANYVNILQNVADMENWMRLQAANHAAGNWDCFGIQNGQNVYGYVSAETRWTLFMFDFNIALGNRIAWAPGSNLFNNQDANWAQIYANPTFRRMYFRALKELTVGAMSSSTANPLLDAKYNAFVANGLTVSPPDSIKSYLSQASTLIASTVQAADTNRFGTTISTYSTSSNLLTISGLAPLEVTTITVNGESLPVTWTSPVGWSFRFPVPAGSNVFTVLGYDRFGGLVSGGSNQFTVVNSSAPVSPVGSVVFNEINYTPITPEAGYVELYNTSTNTAFDLTGWRINGLGYTFPQGSVIAPNSFLMLARSKPGFIKAYGLFIPVFDTFSGGLQIDGETLTLIQPGPSLAQDIVIDKVRYETVAPWPLGNDLPLGTFSLQTIDPRQDRSRVGNWANNILWRYQTATGTASSSRLLVFLNGIGDLFIDDMKLVYGSVAEAGPNLIVNGDFELPLSNGWVVPAGNSLSQMSVTNVRSGVASLHLVSTNVSATPANALFQTITPALTNGVYTVSYWFRPVANTPTLSVRLNSSTLSVTHSTAPVTAISPGATNSAYAVLPAFPSLWLNELVAENQDGLSDGFGEREPWVEIYNSGTNTISLNGFSLSPDYGNLGRWAFPSNQVINPGQFLVVWCDGQPEQTGGSEFHTSFRLSPGTGSVALARRINGSLQILDYLNYHNLPANQSYGDLPDGQPFDRRVMFFATPGATNSGTSAPLKVVINEWMASNTRTLANSANGNKWDDWFELYNPSTEAANLEGHYLTDTLTNKFQYRIPAGYVIPPGGYLLVWADGTSTLNSTNRPELHVPFQLSKSGEAIGLFAEDGTLIDGVSFGAQTNDVTMGRFPDGAMSIYYLTTPTPTNANYLQTANAAPVLGAIPSFTNYPGSSVSFIASATDTDIPGQTLHFSLDPGAPASAVVNSVSGQFIWSIPGNASASINSITLRVTDSGSPALSASRTFTVTVVVPLRVGSVQSLGGGQFGIAWASLPGKHYQVQYKDNLSAADWVNLGNVVPASNSSTTSINDKPGGAAQRFYRIMALD
ncbi:MAG: putative secreted protein [Verrucomicrobiales bacterium]|nr:putative secreted protein [Verrucomicrobiales bacterium]